VPRPEPPPKTKLAAMRRARDIRQRELAQLAGISEKTVQRLEAGEISDPRLRMLSNCALVLACRLEDIVEDEWVSWTPFDARRAVPPTAEELEQVRSQRRPAHRPKGPAPLPAPKDLNPAMPEHRTRLNRHR
jgi:DNA-binding Xre family transcriptional regulator